jgi:hypothetical protein
MIFFIIAGFATYSANYEGFKFAPSELFNIGSIAVIFFSFAFIIFIHEFAHALTCKYYGGQVREMGFLLLYFQLCFYSNLSDSWMFKRKSHRLAVIWAGLFLQLALFALAVFGWRVTVIGTGINQFFWLTANVCFVTLLFNFNPLIKLDGYYFLSEWVNIPNLRSKSFDHLKHTIKRWLGVETKQPDATSRQRRIYMFYTLFAGAYSIFLIIFMAVIVYRFLVDNLAGFGFILFLILLATIFMGPVVKCFRFLAGRDIMKALFAKPRNLIVGGIIIVTLIIVLFLIPVSRQVGGDVIVRPTAEYTITLLPGQGRLELNQYEGGLVRQFNTEHIQLSSGELSVLRLAPMVKEGDIIGHGDTLAAIISNEVSSNLDAARSQLERLQNELALAKSPPKPEEVESAQAAVNASQANVDQMVMEVDRNDSLYAKRLISKQQLERSQSNLNISKSILEDAKARLKLVKSPPKPEEVAVIESRITTQQANISYLMSQEAAQVIVSPIDGEVVALYRRDLLIKVADLSAIEVAIPVKDNYLEFVDPQADVRLRVRTYPSSIFEGKVTHIAGSAENAEFEDNRARFAVYAAVANDKSLLRDGMSGYAKISCGQASLYNIILGRVKAFIRVEFWSWW